MPNRFITKRPLWLLIAGILFLLWDLAGVAAFVGQATMSPATFAALPKAQQDLFGAMPIWVWIAYAVAVFAAVLGALAVLWRKGWAVGLYAISLLAVLAQFSYPFLIVRAIEIANLAMSGFPLFIIVMGVMQAVLTWRWRAAGWLA